MLFLFVHQIPAHQQDHRCAGQRNQAHHRTVIPDHDKSTDEAVNRYNHTRQPADCIVCDGAKASCAAKIAAAVDAGILGFEMYRNGQQFYGGDGLVKKGVENTIRNISRLGRIGMRETDKEIISMMIGE